MSGSFEFLKNIRQHVPEHFEIATIDVKNLYPSINNAHLIETLTQSVYRHFGRTSFADFIANLLRIALANQYIQHRGEFYQAFGIATGLPPGVFLANIYLNEVDKLVMQRHKDDIGFYARLVDDSVVCASNIEAIQATQNSWRSEIVWEIACRGGRSHLNEPPVAFLDLALTHEFGELNWQMYRKPLNNYLYIHRDSCHPKHVLHGLIKGETVRLWRTNRSHRTLDHHLKVFVKCMARRGHPRHEVWRLISQQLRRLQSRQEIDSNCSERRKFFALIRFSRTAPVRTIKCAFQKHAQTLKRVFKHDISVGLSFQIQPNLFRRHFRDNHWLKEPISL